MRPVQPRLLFVAFVVIVIASVLLAACSPQPALTSVPSATYPVQPGGTLIPALPTEQVQPTLTSSAPTQVSNTEDQVKTSYHTVLRLERAADLILAVIVKIDTGELPMGDPIPRYPYVNAFAVALDDYNKTTPPPGVLNHGWKTVSSVTEQYSIVYSSLLQGKAISNHDLYSLKALRQLMTNYQNMAEGYLTQRGMGADYFSSQQQAVEQHFIQAYGDQPMPT